jgi:hypothetical protein
MQRPERKYRHYRHHRHPKLAKGGRVKTGEWGQSGTSFFFPAGGSVGKSVLVHQPPTTHPQPSKEIIPDNGPSQMPGYISPCGLNGISNIEFKESQDRQATKSLAGELLWLPTTRTSGLPHPKGIAQTR